MTGSDAFTIATREAAHEPFSRARMHGLETDVARLALRVRRTFLYRYRNRPLAFLVRIILLGVTACFDLLSALVMAAFFPVLRLAGRPTVARFAAAALLGQVWQIGSTEGAFCENHSDSFTYERMGLLLCGFAFASQWHRVFLSCVFWVVSIRPLARRYRSSRHGPLGLPRSEPDEQVPSVVR